MSRPLGVSQVAILSILSGAEQESWTVADLAALIRVTHRRALDAVERLEARGLVVRTREVVGTSSTGIPFLGWRIWDPARHAEHEAEERRIAEILDHMDALSRIPVRPPVCPHCGGTIPWPRRLFG
jgi:predicted ArsR family transcriptional regulator